MSASTQTAGRPAAPAAAALTRRALPAAVLALALFAPSLMGSDYLTGVATLALVFVMLAASFNLVYGYTGLMSFAQVGFFGIGAYGAALLVTDVGASPWVGFLGGGVAAGLVAAVAGLPALRLTEDAFAIVTLSFSLLLALIAGDWESLTRGRLGIPGLLPPTLDLGPLHVDFLSPAHYYYLTLAIALAALALLHRVVRSRIGRALVALRENPALAASQGIDPLRHRLFAFVLAAFVSGVAGGVQVFHLSIVDPSVFDFYFMQAMLIMVIVGGPGTFWPVVAAAVIFTALPEALRVASSVRLVTYGALLVLAMLFIPEGIGGRLKRRRERFPDWDAEAREAQA